MLPAALADAKQTINEARGLKLQTLVVVRNASDGSLLLKMRFQYSLDLTNGTSVWGPKTQ